MKSELAEEASFLPRRLRFTAIRSAIRPLARWKPLNDPKPGYSVIIGCTADLLPILRANLELLSKQNRPNLHKVILIFNSPASAKQQIEPDLIKDFGHQLPLQFVYYNFAQNAVMRAIDWGWTYCWMNWVLGLGASETRHVLIHDLDAMLLDADMLETRVAATIEADAPFSGSKYYNCGGIDKSDELLTTFEMVCDVQLLRRQFKPIDCFNVPAKWKGRRIVFDTLLWPQTKVKRGALLPIGLTEMVHPSQMISQYVAVKARAAYTPPETNNILMIPYFMELGGETASLSEHQAALNESDGHTVRCFGRPLDFRNLSVVHARWLTEQGHRLDCALHGAVRPHIRAYFASIEDLITRRDGLRKEMLKAQAA